MELLFLALLVLASLLDASGRRKRRQRRVEDMEVDEAREDAVVGTAEPGSRRPRVRDRPRGARAVRLPPLPESVEADATTAPPKRETADSMIPSDLWSILTGESAPPRPPAPPRPEAPSRPELPPPPEPDPTYETWGGEDIDDLHRPEHHPGDTPTAPSQPAAVSTPIVATSSPPPAGLAPVPVVRRSSSPGRPASVYAALLKAGQTDSLRRAIVLKEILDPPPGLQPPGKLK